MAISKEDEVQRLILLGAISTLEEHERDEIFAIKNKLLTVCGEASKKEFALAAVGLMAADLQKEE